MKKLSALLILLVLAAVAPAATLTRYFSTTSAGAADGTSWANRAALFSSGNWSSVITGVNFTTDKVIAYVGPGTYTCGQQFQNSLFTNPPTAAGWLEINGCDSSGNALTPPDPDWTCDLPPWDDSGLPVINTSTNVVTSSQAVTMWRLVKFTSSARTTGALLTAGLFDWCSVSSSASNTSAGGAQGVRMHNSLVAMTGASYSYAVNVSSNGQGLDNSRLTGVTGSSGNRNGIDNGHTGAGTTFRRVFITGFGGNGFSGTGGGTTINYDMDGVMAVGNGGDGFRFPSTASQTGLSFLNNCWASGNGGYGFNAQTNANVWLTRCRSRNNSSGDTNGLSQPTPDFYTTSATDAAEFVNSGAGNYQIKSSAVIANQGYGISQQSSGGQRSFSF